MLAVALLHAQDSSLTLTILEGEGVIYQLGSRSARGLTVEVTDASGRQVQGATVSFRLPEQGPTGAFASGSRSEIVTTGPDGRAAAWGMRWGNTPGPVEIRVTAVRGDVRASRVAQVTLTKAVSGPTPAQVSSGSSHKWLWITLAVAGAAAGGIATSGLAGHANTTATSTAVPPPTIGQPTININRP